MATNHNFRIKNGLEVRGSTLVVNSTESLSGTQVYIKKLDGSTNLQRWGEGTSGASTYRFRIDQNFKFIGNSGSGDTIQIRSDIGSITTPGSITITSNSNGLITRQILARDTNGLSLKTTGGTEAIAIDNSANVNVPNGAVKVSGTTVIDNSRKIYPVNIQNSGAISFLNGSAGTSGSGAQGISVRDLYAGTTYANRTGAAGTIDALNGFKVAGQDVIDNARNLTNIAAATIAGNVLINGAHDNNGNAKLAVESGTSYPQISLYSDQVQLGNTSMNYNFKIHTDSGGAKLTAWNSDITIGAQGSNTGSASARNIIFKPQISGTAVSTERMRLRGEDGILEIGAGLGGLVIDSGGNKEIVEGRRYNWYLMGMGTQTDYYKICTVSIATGLYKALAMKVTVESQLGNFGNQAQVETAEYNVTYYRSSNVQDNVNNAVIYGTNPGNHTLRVMKTATGTYELQIKQDSSYKDALVKIQVLSTNGGTIVMSDGFVVGSSSGTEYTADTNSNAKKFFPGNVHGHQFLSEGTASNSVPKYSFEGDTNTGLGYIGSDQVGLISGGSRKFYVHSTAGAFFQNVPTVTIATTGTGDARHFFIDGPDANYDFRSNSTSGYTTTFNMDNTGLEIGHNSASRNLALQTNSTDRLTIGGGGDVNIASNLSIGNELTIPAAVVHAGDTNTTFGFHGNDLFRVVTGGTERFEVSNSGIIINDGGSGYDFRVESDSNTHMLFVDGSEDKVGINTASPSGTFHAAGTGMTFDTPDGSGLQIIRTGNSAHLHLFPAFSSVPTIQGQGAGGLHLGYNSATAGIRIDTSNNVGIGTTSPSATLHVADVSNNSVTSLRLNSMFSVSGDGVVHWGSGAPGGGFGQLTWDTGKAYVRGQSGKALHLGGGGRANDIVISTAGAVTFNSAYTFPSSDGSANQVLQTDGSGNLSFATVTSGGGAVDSIANFANNRIITATDSDSLTGETNLTFDGNKLQVITPGAAVTTNDAGITMRLTGSYSDGRYEHRFRKLDEGGGIPLYIDKTSGTAGAHTAIARFGNYSGQPDEFEVYGNSKISGTLTVTGDTNTTGKYRVLGSGTLLDLYESSWSNATTHNILYNGWTSSTGDYIYLAAAGNGTPVGRILVTDSAGFFFGTSSSSTGAIADSATAPLTNTRFRIDNSGNATIIGDITQNDNKNITLYHSANTSATSKINLPRGGAITFYGNQNLAHSICSRNAAGNATDNLRFNSYAGMYFNLDSNSNNTSSADFRIGHHGSGTSTPTTLVTISGETGHATFVGSNSAEDVIKTTNGRIQLGPHSSGAGLWFDQSSAARRWFIGLNDSDGSTLRFYWGGSGAGNKFSITSGGAITATSYSGGLVSGVTATTQSASDNSTKVATTAYVTTAISNLVDSAPGTLNTLNELAAALGDDASFSTTVTNSIATKAPIASPTFTGDITIPDQIIHTGDTNTYLQFHTNDQFRVVAGGNEVTEWRSDRMQMNNKAITWPTWVTFGETALSGFNYAALNAPIHVSAQNVGTTNQYLPFLQGSAQHGSGYRTSYVLGAYKRAVLDNGTTQAGWGDGHTGFFMAMGNSDNNPTTEFRFSWDGHIWHTTGGSGTYMDLGAASNQISFRTNGSERFRYNTTGGSFMNGSDLTFYTSSGLERGFLKATETNDEHFIIATSGGEDIAFKDGGLSGTTNLISRGDGNLWVRGSILNGTIAYSQVTGTPTIPTNNNQLTNGAGYLTASSTSLDSRYYTESEMQTYFKRGYIEAQTANALAVGWYTVATNTGDRAIGDFTLWDVDSSDHQGISFKASHMFGNNNSNDITVLHYARYSGTPIRYIRIKEGGTYDGAALQVYIDQTTNNVGIAITGGNPPISGWVLKDWIPDATDPGDLSSYGSFVERTRVDLDLIVNGGMQTTGNIIIGNPSNVESGTNLSIYQDSSSADQIKFYDGTTRVGEIGTQDGTWLRINNQTNKNIYTPRYIRADNGFYVDGTSIGITGSGNLIGIGTVACGAITSTGNTVLTGSGSDNTTNAFTVKRGVDSGNALRIQNSGEVVVENHYLYAARSSGAGLYVQAGAVFRGGISNDTSGQPVTINDNLQLNGSMTATGAITASGDILAPGLYVGSANTSFDFYNNGTSYLNGNTTVDATLTVSSTGTAGAPTVDIINSSSGTFNHSVEAITPNLTAGENNIILIGKASDTKNAGYIGYKFSSAASNANVLTFGHWGSDNLMNLDGVGNLGIGTQAPQQSLHIEKSFSSGTQENTFILLESKNTGSDLVRQKNFIDFQFVDSNANFTPQVRIGAEVGQNGDANSLTLEGSGAFVVYTATGSEGVSGTLSEKMRVDYQGNVGIGTTTPAQKLHVNSGTANINTRFESTDTAVTIQLKDSTGTATIESRNDFRFKTGTSDEKVRITTAGDLHVEDDVIAFSTTVSDIRLKENIKPIKNATDKVKRLAGVTFDWKKDGEQSAGLIAQDVEKVLPSAVKEKELPLKTDDGKEYKTVQYNQVIGLLVEAVKEQQETINKLTDRINGLENKD